MLRAWLGNQPRFFLFCSYLLRLWYLWATWRVRANQNGFSLNAAVACQPHQRDKLERLCRYVTRPAICLERLTLRADGQVQYQLKHPFRDRTTHILFSPLDFIGKLVALVPKPRHNLVRYHGVLAANAKLRKYIVPATVRTKPATKRKADHKKDKPTTGTREQDTPIKLRCKSLTATLVSQSPPTLKTSSEYPETGRSTQAFAHRICQVLHWLTPYYPVYISYPSGPAVITKPENKRNSFSQWD